MDDLTINKYTKNLVEATITFFENKFYSCLESESSGGTERFLKALDEKTTSSERVMFIHKKLGQLKLLQAKYTQDYKCDTKAATYKKKANQYYLANKFSKALRSYTRSLMRARHPHRIAQTYAHRSDALFRLGLYPECQADISRAFEYDYQGRRNKLIARRNKVMKLLTSYEKPKFHETVPMVSINLAVPCASNSVEIQPCRTGEKVVATKTIQIGDVIAVEEPLSPVIGNVYVYHCHECFDLCYNPIPCDGCTEALYCGRICKQKALDNYHRHECPILLSLRKAVGKARMLRIAMRMFLQTKGQLSNKIFKLIQKVPNEKFEEQIQLEMSAAVMYDLMKNQTSRFNGPNGEAIEKSFKENIVALLKVSLLQSSWVEELCPLGDDNKLVIDQDCMAMAIFPFFKTCRHSCAPNVLPYHYGMKRVLRAIRTIQQGQEVLVSYGPVYMVYSTAERQSLLSRRYHFQCTCRACKENWEQAEALKDRVRSEEDGTFLAEMNLRPNVALAKTTVPKKIKTIQLMEQLEPSVPLTLQMQLLSHCYDVLGNKRLIK